MKVVAVIGMPGAGKTTLFRKFMEQEGYEKEVGYVEGLNLVPFHRLGYRTIVLGKYDDPEQVFAGTDRMSMAVQPEAVKFLDWVNSNTEDYTVFFEGDRLSTQSFLENCADKYDTTIVYLKVSDAERERRYAERGSDQSETFIKGRQSKYSGIMSNMVLDMCIETFVNDTPADQAKILDRLNQLKG